MGPHKMKSLIISDFNCDLINGCLSNDTSEPLITAYAAPFGQALGVLIDATHDCWQEDHDFAIIWTQPESIIKSFCLSLNYQYVPVDQVLKEVDEYSQILKGIAQRIPSIFIPLWVVPTSHRGFGMLDMKTGLGVANTLMRMNLRLCENLENERNIYLLNTQKWIENVGKIAFNPKLWYMGKIPFDVKIFKMAASEIKAALQGISGNARKIVIVDLDDTLWGGVVGEVGWQGVKLGGHDPLGEAFVDFQRALKSLINRGILLGIVSKNEEAVAIEAVKNHPEMVLKLDDFSGWRINWEDKAKNILELIAELNLGLQSAVFIDDNPSERGRVKAALPEVLVPEWPEDKMLYARHLLSLPCFDTPSFSEEDKQRVKMYRAEKKRLNLQKTISTPEEWLKTMAIQVTVEKINETNLPRAVQLLNKTNQMNLTTRRMPQSELMDWIKKEEHYFWTFRVADTFGDSGLTGLMSMEINGKKGQIVDFVLSCRVFGRKVEESMVSVAMRHGEYLRLEEIIAQYIPTSKNEPCLKFWKRSGFHCDDDQRFYWKMTKKYADPKEINVIVK